MEFGFTTAAYVVAAVLFIFSLGGLSGQESAKRAVWYGIVGMAIAVLATLIGPGAGLWWLSIILIAGGAVVGYMLATKVEMTQMPELVAIMHSLVGLAAVFVGFNADIMINTASALYAANGGVLGAVGPDGYTAIGLPKEVHDGERRVADGLPGAADRVAEPSRVVLVDDRHAPVAADARRDGAVLSA